MKKPVSALFVVLMLFYNAFIPALCKTKSEQNDYIKIEQTTRHLHSRLSKKYTGYDYTIKNIYKTPVTIQSVSVWDNANNKVAYLSVKRTGMRAATETMGVGIALALPTLCLSVVGAAVAVPFIIAGNQIGNVGANQEAHRYDKMQTEPVTLKPQEKIELKTMALHRHAPSMRIVFVNPLTDENMSLELK
jgi:hypothetical protein